MKLYVFESPVTQLSQIIFLIDIAVPEFSRDDEVEVHLLFISIGFSNEPNFVNIRRLKNEVKNIQLPVHKLCWTSTYKANFASFWAKNVIKQPKLIYIVRKIHWCAAKVRVPTCARAQKWNFHKIHEKYDFHDMFILARTSNAKKRFHLIQESFLTTWLLFQLKHWWK